MMMATVTALLPTHPVAVHAAPAAGSKKFVTWAFCGVRPSDPSALAAAKSMATFAGVSATFGPCNVPTNYTPVNPGNRYVDPDTYMQLVNINAQAGMKTVVYDARIWSDDAKVRDRAIRFWEPVYNQIQAWDLGDEFQPNQPEWDVLVHRWNLVLGDATLRSGILPFTNLPSYDGLPISQTIAVDKALATLPGSDQLISFDQYTGDLGASIARAVDSRVKTVMCAVNVYAYSIFAPTPTKIRADMASLADADCDQFLIFGGERVYDSTFYGTSSLVDTTGAPTTWATAVLEGSGTSSYTALSPARLLDSRPGSTTVDGQSAGIGLRPDGSVTEVLVAGRAGVSATATSVTLNVAVTDATNNGYLTVYPCGTTVPTAAQVNYIAGTDVSTAVVAKVGSNGKVCMFNSFAADLVVDVNGFFPNGAAFVPLAPARMLETRPGLSTVDGAYNGVTFRGAGSVTQLQISGRGGVPLGATDVVLAVTATNTVAPGYVTVFPCTDAVPVASNVNYGIGSTVTNAVIAPLRSDGAVCLYTLSDIDLVVDVNGYFPARSSFVSLAPSRLMDTRPAAAGATAPLTIDGQQGGIGTRIAGSVTELQVTGRAGIPTGAGAAVLNMTITNPTRSGFVTAFPCGQPRPLASNVNVAAGATVANMVVSKIGANGRVCLYTSIDADIIADATNYFP